MAQVQKAMRELLLFTEEAATGTKRVGSAARALDGLPQRGELGRGVADLGWALDPGA